MEEYSISTESARGADSSLLSDFPSSWREGVYQAIYRRRDVRHFRPDPVPADVLARDLDAAHHAPSVGFMQPWTFIVISDQQTWRRVRDLYEKEKLLFPFHLPPPPLISQKAMLLELSQYITHGKNVQKLLHQKRG